MTSGCLVLSQSLKIKQYINHRFIHWQLLVLTKTLQQFLFINRLIISSLTLVCRCCVQFALFQTVMYCILQCIDTELKSM